MADCKEISEAENRNRTLRMWEAEKASRPQSTIDTTIYGTQKWQVPILDPVLQAASHGTMHIAGLVLLSGPRSRALHRGAHRQVCRALDGGGGPGIEHLQGEIQRPRLSRPRQCLCHAFAGAARQVEPESPWDGTAWGATCERLSYKSSHAWGHTGAPRCCPPPQRVTKAMPLRALMTYQWLWCRETTVHAIPLSPTWQ